MKIEMINWCKKDIGWCGEVEINDGGLELVIFGLIKKMMLLFLVWYNMLFVVLF